MKIILLSVLYILLYTNIFAQSNLRCTTYGSPTSLGQFNEIGCYLDNFLIEFNSCGTTPSIHIVVIDSNCNVWDNCNYNFGQWNQFVPIAGCDSIGTGTCRSRAEKYFIFRLNNPANIDSLAAMLMAIPHGNYILAYTWFTYSYSTIPAFTLAFQNLGATLINTLPDTVPYIFFMKAGQTSSILETVGINNADTLTLNSHMNCIYLTTDEYENEPFTIFPDPHGELIHITNINPGAQWSIYDLTGKLIKSGQLQENKIHYGRISKAIYLITLQSEGKYYRKLFTVN